MRVESENLSYTYGKKTAVSSRALDGVNCVIEDGDFFGIIGKTGSGKSTFVQHLNGLIKIAEGDGKIVVGNFDLSDKKCDFSALRSKVGMVFQYPEYQLFAETVEQDVMFGLKNFFPDMGEEEKIKMTRAAIETVGLDYEAVKDKSPFELSGGQKRRVAIAGVIVSSPSVLVLDEPAAGLDPQGKKEFLALLKNLHGKTVKTVIIVSHDMNLIAEYCNRVAVFSDGKVVKVGSPEEIFSSEKEISEAGLTLPLIAKLTHTLKEAGADIKNDLSEEGFIEAAAEFFKAKEGGKTL